MNVRVKMTAECIVLPCFSGSFKRHVTVRRRPTYARPIGVMCREYFRGLKFERSKKFTADSLLITKYITFLSSIV